MRRLTGIGVSPGVVSGRAVILIQRAQVLRYQIARGRLEHEVARLEQSRARTREQLLDIRARVARRRGPELAALFDAQLLMLDDPMLVPRAAALIREQRVNAEWAVQQVFHEFSAVFDEVADAYLRERKGDVADLVGRLRMNLREGVAMPRDLLREVEESSVLIADELTPSLAAQIDWTKVRGFATDAGSRTYHTAILARSLEVPAVVGLHDASRVIQAGELIVLDGDRNEVIVDPDPEVLARVTRSAEDHRPAARRQSDRRGPVTTADGVQIRLDANIEFPDDLAAARYAVPEHRAIPFGVPADRRGRRARRGRAVRRLSRHARRDGAGRRHRPHVRCRRGSAQPALRAPVRVGLAGRSHAGQPPRAAWPSPQPDAARALPGQLRALLRAARHGTLRITFPFVSGVDELRAARSLIAKAAADLAARGEQVPEHVPIGVMIEIPAAAYTADPGTRGRFLHDWHQRSDSVLSGGRSSGRAGVGTVRAAASGDSARDPHGAARGRQARRIPVAVCGEMASDPALLTLLVGLGLTEFSMTPAAIGVARQVLSEVRYDELGPLGAPDPAVANRRSY